jgi:hypothetical protein
MINNALIDLVDLIYICSRAEFRTLFVLFLVISSHLSFVEGKGFNYEITSHTRTAIMGILSKVSFAVDVPVAPITFGKDMREINELIIPSIEIKYLVEHLYPLMTVFSDKVDVTAVYLTLDSNGNFIGYIEDLLQPHGLAAMVTDPYNYYGDSKVENYIYYVGIDKYGYPINLF